MIKRLLLPCLALALITSSGCLFSKKSGKAKESSAIAGENEEMFKRRWIDKRITELVPQGIGAEAARTQAAQEFDEKFAFSKPLKK